MGAFLMSVFVFKTMGTRLGVIIVPIKGLEQALHAFVLSLI